MAEHIIYGKTLNFIADAVREKAGITNDMTPEEIIREVYLLETDTDVGAPAPGVIFYDYDGTILHSYTVKEARALTALPDGPVHDGLPFAGWTHTLEEVNATMKILHVGAMYESETTKLTVFLYDTNDITLNFQQSVSNGVTVYWGDGASSTAPGTGWVNISHKYPDYEIEYTIELVVTSGTLTLGGFDDYMFGTDSSGNAWPKNKILTKVIIGATNTIFSYHTFGWCINLKSIVISKGVTKIGEYQFYNCESLTHVTIPNSVTVIDEKLFHGCKNISSVVLPNSITYMPPLVFDNNKVENFVCPNVNVINGLLFGKQYAKNIYFMNPTPPRLYNSISYYSPPATTTIYVPYKSLEQYKTAAYWSDVADQIKGMPIDYVDI